MDSSLFAFAEELMLSFFLCFQQFKCTSKALFRTFCSTFTSQSAEHHDHRFRSQIYCVRHHYLKIENDFSQPICTFYWVIHSAIEILCKPLTVLQASPRFQVISWNVSARHQTPSYSIPLSEF